MKNTNRIYKVYGENIIQTICFEQNTLDIDIARTWFDALHECVDINHCELMDATTGEIIDFYRNWGVDTFIE